MSFVSDVPCLLVGLSEPEWEKQVETFLFMIKFLLVEHTADRHRSPCPHAPSACLSFPFCADSTLSLSIPIKYFSSIIL